MINPIKHYSLENTASVYDEEALTALELTARTAAKVNEAVELVNENEKEVANAKEYMTTNLPDFAADEIDKLYKSGELETLLVKATNSGKVDKGGNEQITYKMLAQDVKQAITGDNTAVVGVDAVNTSNIVDNSVNEDKLARYLHEVNIQIAKASHNLPLLYIDTTTATATVNTAITDSYTIYTQNGSQASFTASDISVDTTYLSAGATSIALYYNPDTKIMYVCNYGGVNDTIKQCYFLGRRNSSYTVITLKITLSINGQIAVGGENVNVCNLPDIVLPTATTIYRYSGGKNNVVFNIDTINRTVNTVTGGVYNLYLGHKVVQIDFNTLAYDFSAIPATYTVCWCFYDEYRKTVVFNRTANNIPSNYIYLGMIFMDEPHRSESLFPFSIDETYLYFPKQNVRQDAHLLPYFYNCNSESVPYIDFEHNKLVFPSLRALYIVTPNSYFGITPFGANNTGDYTVDLNPNTFTYIVGGENGLVGLTATEFINLKEACNGAKYFYFGCIHDGTKQHSLNFEVNTGGSLSVLGDSISTNKGDIPDTNQSYYDTDSENCWWNRVMRKCGLRLEKNNSWSGCRVTNTGSATVNGMELCKSLDNGGTPDNIIIYLGINDFINNVPLGTYDGRGVVPTNGATFREAYAIMLHNVMTAYPNSKLYVCTLPACEHFEVSATYSDVNNLGLYLWEYNEAIEEIARRFHVEVIDLSCCGLNMKNGTKYMHDFNEDTGRWLHPNSDGHRLIAEKVNQSLMYGKKVF